jgi:hypothetical protein
MSGIPPTRLMFRALRWLSLRVVRRRLAQVVDQVYRAPRAPSAIRSRLMLTTHELSTSIRFERDRVHTLLTKMYDAGWIPAAHAAEREFLRHAGLDNLEATVRTFDRSVFAGPDYAGDVFFRDTDLYYLLLTSHSPREARGSADQAPTLTVGLITEASDASAERLYHFAEVVSELTKGCVDGRRARHMRFNWAPDTAVGRQLQRFLATANPDGERTFDGPVLPEATVTAATVLAGDAAIRSLMVEISKGRFVRAQHLVRSQRTGTDKVEQSITRMKDATLIVSRYLLLCRQNSTEITQFDSPEELAAHGSLRHAACNRFFIDELLEEGYSLSEMGRTLITRSEWMTIWVAANLHARGVPTDAMLCNVAESGEEVDLVIEFVDELWIFELKDRNFEAGDAQRFHYRRVRYDPHRALIITTGKVSPDAKRVFEDLHREQDRVSMLRTGRVIRPVFIEGLDAVPDALSEQLSLAERAKAIRHLRPLSRATGFELDRLISARQRLTEQ